MNVPTLLPLVSPLCFSFVPACCCMEIKYFVKKRKRILSAGESVEGRRENIRSCYFITQITLIWEFFISRALNHSAMFSFGLKSDSRRLRRSVECQPKHFLVLCTKLLRRKVAFVILWQVLLLRMLWKNNKLVLRMPGGGGNSANASRLAQEATRY